MYVCQQKDIMSKDQMLKFCKSGLIATSHVRIHDTENMFLACNIFKVALHFFQINIFKVALHFPLSTYSR